MGWGDDVLAKNKITLWDGSLKKYNANVNLKAFYNELHDVLDDKNFQDAWTVYNKLNKGEFPDNDKFTRTNDYYETKFVVIDKGDGSKELEIVWEAVTIGTPHCSKMGKIHFKLDLSVRNWKKLEVLEGNQKVTYDSGGWEFRNKLEYENTIVEDYLENIPFVKSRTWLQKLYIENVYMPNVKHDIEKHILVRIVPAIQGVIDKYFVDNSY